MLVITRRFGEWFHLTLPNGDVIRIAVKDTSRRNRDSVSVVIDAPRNIHVDRRERLGENNRKDGLSAQETSLPPEERP